MQSMLINTEALESPLYNPPMDPKALMLQEIMETTPQVQTFPKNVPPLLTKADLNDWTLEEHLDTWNSLPTANPFQGVIVNPLECFLTPMRDDIRYAVDVFVSRHSNDPDWVAYYPEFNDDCYGTNPGDPGIVPCLDQIENHSDKLTSNIPSLSGIAQAFMALDTVMNLLSNPCLGLDNFFGSIQAKGKAMLASIKAKLQPMIDKAKAAIGDVKAMIATCKAAIADAKAAVTAFIQMARDEVTKFLKALRAQVRQGLADLMAALGIDPCMKSMLKDIAQPAALAVLGG